MQPCIQYGANESTLGFLATDQASGAVHSRIERRLGGLAVHAFDDHRVVAHRAADEAALAWEGWRCALADNPKIAPVVRLAPGVVMVVVHHVGDAAADDPAHALDHPFPARVGIAARELHGCDVAPAEF